ncbi:MAG: PGPGW domain-containing protein [Dokdonella sp.]
MFNRWRDDWQAFRTQPAGKRFQQRYRRRTTRSGPLRKFAFMLAGLLLIALGVVMIVLPGPGLLAILLGAGFVAEESQFAARVLDRVDLWISRRIERWRRAA